MKARVIETRQSNSSVTYPVMRGPFPDGPYKFAKLLIAFESPSGLAGYLDTHLDVPIDILGEDVQIGDEFTIYVERSR